MYEQIAERNRKLNLVFKKYETLFEKFKGLLSTANNNIDSIGSLSIIEEKNNELVIQVLGQRVKIKFSMVIHLHNPLGQISAILVKNEGTVMVSESTILVRWFDDLGNVKGDKIEQNAGENIEHDKNYLENFIYIMTDKLLLSEHVQPMKNNG